jgi:antitoxin YefM
MNNFISISDAKSRLPQLISRVNKHDNRFIITVRDHPKAVLMSVEKLESLEETVEVLSIPGIIQSIRKSKNQFRKGNFIELSELI